MPQKADKLNTKSRASEDRRKCFAEAKVHQNAQQPEFAARECQQLITYLNRLGFTRQNYKILDLGCGTGRLTVELAKLGYNAYGTDINPDFIEIARDKAQKMGVSAQVMVAPSERLPFDDNFFDVCLAVSVLEHVADWKKTVSEVARILKPGGIAYFDTTNALNPLPGEVKHVPCMGYIPRRLRSPIIDLISARFPALVGYSLTPAKNWFTQTGLKRALSLAGFKQSWDIFDLINKQDIPRKYQFASWLLPIIKKLPYPYIRDIAHFPLSVRLFCQKG
jgi:2-polyprenyl-3-methyl-5-hydroxy-6-metoxy-1,4-benzoquinol methylase